MRRGEAIRSSMRRREFIGGFGAAIWPVVAKAQQPGMPVIGLLSGFAAATSLVTDFRRGLKETGFVEGQNVVIDYRSADGRYDRLPQLAADLISERISVIVALGENAALAVKAARIAGRNKVPFVFSLGEDPVAMGLVPGLDRPVDDVTGVTSITKSLELKRWELLREFVPNASSVAVLVNPRMPREFDYKNVGDVARSLGLRLEVVHASDASEFDPVFAMLARGRVSALIIIADTYFTSNSDKLGSLALRYTIPAMYSTREFVVAGGLVSYGSSIPDTIRQAGVYAGKILAGVRPADLPVMQPTKFELIINLKTAKTLGLTVPETRLATADDVID
jgi:putative tryptophan/tyrosine transport system substrate-binding protein